MNQHQLKQFIEETKSHNEMVIKETIEKTVNGKIISLREEFRDYVFGDMAWKKDNQAALDNMKNLTSGWKVILSTFGGIGVIAASIVAIRKFLNI